MLSAITKAMIHDVFQYEEVNKTSTKCVCVDGNGKETIEKGYLYNYNQKQKKWYRYPVSDELQETVFFSHLGRAKACKKDKRLAYYDETVSDQFSGFGLNFWKSLGLWIVSTFWIAFLTCLLIIPGVIASCAYSQIYRVLLYYPDMPVLEVMARSRQMMKGHKWDYFVLQLSYIGWDFLSLLTFGLLQFYIIPYRSQANFVYFQELEQQQETNQDSAYLSSDTALPPYEEAYHCTFQVTNAYHRHSYLFLEGDLQDGAPFYGKALLIVSDGKEDLFSQYIQVLETACDRDIDNYKNATVIVKLENPEEEIQIGDIVTLEEQ